MPFHFYWKGEIYWSGPFETIYFDVNWDNIYKPPPWFFKEARTTLRLFASFFSFDWFRLYSLLYFGECSRKQSNIFAHFCKHNRILFYFGAIRNLFAVCGKSCYYARVRAPPRKSELETNPIQIFGGKKMAINAHLKIFQNFFQNHQVSLGVSLLGLFVGPERKGVSTWAYMNAAWWS